MTEEPRADREGEEEGDAPSRFRSRAPKEESFRVPAWVAPILTTAAGWFTAQWPGALFGLVAGLLLWRSRR